MQLHDRSIHQFASRIETRTKDVMSGLRKVKCPACGFEYWTNRDTDLCIDCEKKGVHLQR